MVKEFEFGWPGTKDKGDLLFIHEVEDDDGKLILNFLKEKMSLRNCSIKKLHSNQSLSGAYHVFDQYNMRSYFLRISDRLGDPKLELSLERFLIEGNVNVNHSLILGAEILYGDETYRIDVREYLNGKHYDNKLSELTALMSQVKKMHKLLANFNQRKIVASNQKELLDTHYKVIDITYDAIRKSDFSIFKERKSWVNKHREWVQEAFEFYQEFTQTFEKYSESQPLHGQIHPGNVIFIDNEAHIFDLETSIKTFCPVSWDLAYIIQRFCFIDNPNEDELKKRISIILNGYDIDASSIKEMMRCISIYNVVCALGYRFFNEWTVPESEYDKFYKYDSQAKLIEI